ncbi:hypothetical protein AGOR_G00223550 [Albula goreensis]|uniref:Ig-like domain-containing protein n=1 Tax=Albula goreensis TaxID=1534307 RepID=A0A8T3CJM2_9TELE|nr:hypothetical protein AGOR_G00223550 [Albula goreensis]
MGQPTLSRVSSYSAFSPGEQVRFRCAAPGGSCAPMEFRLHKSGDGTPVVQSTQARETSVELSVSNLDTSHQGSYSCMYSIQGTNSRSSPNSNSISISVVNLPKPRISVSNTEVTWGHRVDITCSITTEHSGGTFVLQKPSGSLTKAASYTSAIFTIMAVAFDHGIYHSQHLLQLSGRRGHLGPQGPEVIRGYSFTITCSTEPQYPEGSFHLTFSGSNMTDTQAAVNHSASFIFPAAEFSHQGNYSCIYETTVSTRSFRSPESEPLSFAVRASLVLPISLGVSGGVVLLVLVPLVIFLVLKKRHNSQEQAQKRVSGTCVMNTYAKRRSEEEDEEEEEDYVNADVACAKDYEEVEEEDDGSEADYENISQSGGAYHAEENIYQNYG